MTELIYKDLSYKLTGLAFEVENITGIGHNEKIYADTFAKLLEKAGITYERELYFPIKVDDKVIKKYYFDFLVDDKVIIELKASDINYKLVCSQVFKYLKLSNKKLGLIFRFTKGGVRVKRIPNFY